MSVTGLVFILLTIFSAISTAVEIVDEDVVYLHEGVLYREQESYTDIDANVIDDYLYDIERPEIKMMKGAYQLSNSFVDDILSEVDPNEFLEVDKISHEISVKTITYDRLNQFSGLVTLFVFLLGFALLFPICGLIYSCCRCCGRCGAKSVPRQKKADHCQKIWQGSLMIVLLGALLFCMWIAFGSGEGTAQGVLDLPLVLRENINDIELYFENTEEQLQTLLVTNFCEFKNKVNTDITDLGTDIKREIESFPELDNTQNTVDDFVTKITTISKNLKDFLSETTIFSEESKKKNDDLVSCLQVEHQEDANKLQQYSDIISKIELFNFQPMEELLNTINSESIGSVVTNLKETYDDLKQNIQEKIDTNMGQANDALNTAQVEIDRNLQSITKSIRDVTSSLTDGSSSTIDDIDDNIQQYLPYVHAVTGISATILLIIVVCLIFGLLWGTFGKVATPRKNSCASKSVGSKFMICAVGLMFSFAFFLALIALAFSIVGILPQKVFCEPMRHPKDSKIMQLLDDAIVFSSDIEVTISDVITNCEDNQAIYQAFQFNEQFDLEQITVDLQINETIDNAISAIEELFPETPDTIISTEIKEQLNSLLENIKDANFEISDEPINAIEHIVHELPSDTCNAEEYYQYLSDNFNKMKTSLDEIKKSLNTISENVQKLYDSTDSLKDSLDTKKTNLLTVTEDSSTKILTKIENYTNRLLHNIQSGIGKCKPLYKTLDSFLKSTCDRIVQQANGFWFSLFWALVFFIPTIFLATSLASLYQKFDDSHFVKPTELDIYNGYGHGYGYRNDGYEMEDGNMRYADPYYNNNNNNFHESRTRF